MADQSKARHSGHDQDPDRLLSKMTILQRLALLGYLLVLAEQTLEHTTLGKLLSQLLTAVKQLLSQTMLEKLMVWSQSSRGCCS